MRFLKVLIALAVVCSIWSCEKSVDEGQLNSKPSVIPAIQEWKSDRGFFKVSSKTTIGVHGDGLSAGLLFSEMVNSANGLKLEVSTNGNDDSDIIFSLTANDPELGDEGYLINIGEKIVIEANALSGLFYGSQTLMQMLVQDSLKNCIPKGKIRDYPLVKERAFMIDIGRKYFSMDYIKKTIRNMAWYKLNVFHIHFTDWSGFRLKSDKFPGLASSQAYSKEEIREIQDYAEKYHVMVVPEIDLPAHATEILRYNPSFGFECESMLTAKWLPDSVNETKDGWMLDITKPEVRQFVTELFDEFIPLFDAPYFHIGGDEWQFDNQKEACPELMKFTKDRGYEYPGDIYVEWINEVNKLVKSHGKTTQIWNWWRYSSGEKLQNKTSIQPDNDIIITVWNKPRQNTILADGYKVIITPEEGIGALYITPGLKGAKPGDYGYFDCRYNYEEWQPVINPQIIGYKVCLWTDAAEHMKDEWFDQFVDKPKAVLAEKTWGKTGSADMEDFFIKMDKIGLNPCLD